MTLEAKLRDIQKKLEDNRNFPNESSISQGIVLPILQELNWDIFDTKVVCPEWRIPSLKPRGKGNTAQVDFALFESPGTPAKVFIEVKARGFKNDPKPMAETQLSTYANAGGIPLAVLTDGGTWSFYLPMEAVKSGSSGLKGRQVFELDISKSSSFQESSEVLQRYLEKNRVVSDEAHETARVIFLLEKYRNRTELKWVSANEEIKKFKEGYNQLAKLAKSIDPKSAQDNFDYDFVVHSLLRQEISRSTSGITALPLQSELERQDFSSSQLSGASEQKQPVHHRVRQDSPPLEPEARPVRDLNVHVKGRGPDVLIKEIVIRGQHFPCSNQKGNQKEAMAIVFKQLQEEDPGFLQRFYKDSRNQRRWRGGPRYLGRNQRELFGKNVERTRYELIGRDWIISTNYGWEAPRNRSSKKKIIQLAAEVAGLKLKLEEDISGKGIIVNLDT